MTDQNKQTVEKKSEKVPVKKYERETIKENWEKWDFVSRESFIGKFLDQKQTLEGAGIEDEQGKAGDIELLGFEELNSGEKYGIINSGILSTIPFKKGHLYEIVFKTKSESKKTGRKVNIFDVYELTEKK